MALAKKKVLIVDDSRSMGKFLTMVINRDPQLEVVGHALDPFEARDLIKRLNPDVLTLDVEMPRMDGITFLRNLMRLRPMPVVMLSSLTAAGAEVTLDALQIGAVDFAVKQQPADNQEMVAYASDIVMRVRNAALSAHRSVSSQAETGDHNAIIGRSMDVKSASPDVHRVIALGASTGGPAAITEIFKSLQLHDSCMVLSQHMPAHFMEAFANRLNTVGSVRVTLARDGDCLRPGTVYVAPGNQHLVVRRKGREIVAFTSDGPRVHDHRPSVDVMFNSVAEAVGASALGVLLTGMGHDGAQGMCAVRRAGGATVAQDEASSVVWGMPGSAVEAGGADTVDTLSGIASLISSVSRRPMVGRAALNA
ncbi:MAG: chemotaxis response regulator protein-glutamate methylesterase [Pseudomonadota bacterium]